MGPGEANSTILPSTKVTHLILDLHPQNVAAACCRKEGKRQQKGETYRHVMYNVHTYIHQREKGIKAVQKQLLFFPLFLYVCGEVERERE